MPMGVNRQSLIALAVTLLPRTKLGSLLQFTAVLFSVCYLTACSPVPSHSSRFSHASTITEEAGWTSELINTSIHSVRIFRPAKPDFNKQITIFIEGDGLAWLSRDRPSLNPTPINPIGLKLALSHPDSNAIYIARPCQYTDLNRCKISDWTKGRFSSSIVAAVNEAISVIKDRLGSESLILVGYSGGGAIATLIAAGRDDVKKLITVGGNLDHAIWTQHHRISPLTDSLNPIKFVDNLKDIPQWHFVGSNDQIVPPYVSESYKSAFGKSDHIQVILVEHTNHYCCWERLWGNLWLQANNKTINID
ncbi:alpha/beta fold hydrolase [Neptuniibacter halophilus]|uniref:alpha/beta fold hydrolase n=1 Tax=Neptuniibacter halophilus TaxID=651666 RepID=UPI002572B43C|nr:alpha/beta fold hydrolase [Neptuniibacter halophilus]